MRVKIASAGAVGHRPFFRVSVVCGLGGSGFVRWRLDYPSESKLTQAGYHSWAVHDATIGV